MTDQGVFHEDEKIIAIAPEWTKKDLLEKEAIFFLNEVARHLEFSPQPLIQYFNRLKNSEDNPYEKIGLKQCFRNYIIRMKVFSEFWKEYSKSVYQPLPQGITGNSMLNLTGVYKLSEVCQHIPFSPHQMRYQAGKRDNPRQEIGIWKDLYANNYLVDMSVFSNWIKKQWLK